MKKIVITKKKSPHPAKLKKSLQQVHSFLDAFPPKDLKVKAWELVTTAFGSHEADSWSNTQRADMLYFYTRLKKLANALTIIDKQLSDSNAKL